jgi:hypothetical protein
MARRRRRSSEHATVGLEQDLDVPARSMHADPLPIPDQSGGMLHVRMTHARPSMVPAETAKPTSVVMTHP